ncbi:NUDIX domain-containing protein [Ferrovibrio sp.]|uniref:NUDIX domain-containing protein n=1 Tax=Ferrovibrio sp. TaxID=1917215 RepID=UPI0035B0BC3F
MTELPLLLAGKNPLTPSNAAVAIVTLAGERYLLQHRDPLPTIFYPDHWGFFGGALEDAESESEALARELFEEIALDIDPSRFYYFTRFTFDYAFAGGDEVIRSFYEIALTEEEFSRIKLGEGQGFAAPDAASALRDYRMTPYDSFTLWMHASKTRLAFPPARRTGIAPRA